MKYGTVDRSWNCCSTLISVRFSNRLYCFCVTSQFAVTTNVPHCSKWCLRDHSLKSSSDLEFRYTPTYRPSDWWTTKLLLLFRSKSFNVLWDLDHILLSEGSVWIFFSRLYCWWLPAITSFLIWGRLEIHDPKTSFPFAMVPLPLSGWISVFLHGPVYTSAVMASRSLWNLFIFCYCTVLSNIYRRYTRDFCQCRLEEQVKF